MKKLGILILFFIISFSFFLMTYFKKRNYKLTYNIDSYKVIEEYNKKEKVYLISVTNNVDTYNYIISDKYSKSRKLVKKIKTYKDDDEKCLVINFKNKDIIPSCKRKSEQISFHLVSNKLKKKINYQKYLKKVSNDKYEYKNIYVEALNNKKVLVWNYNGFYILNSKGGKDLKLTTADIYNPSTVGQIGNYIVVPDYDQGYEYNKLKVLNVNSLDVSSLKINKSLSSDSYTLGTNDESIFIYDRKYERELEIVPSKLKHRYVEPYIYENGKIVSKTTNYLSNNKAEFIYNTSYDYVLSDNRLYRLNKHSKNKTLITDTPVKEIIKKDNDAVYYLSGSSLFMYKDVTGEVFMLSYDELDFNYKNIIYIF